MIRGTVFNTYDIDLLTCKCTNLKDLETQACFPKQEKEPHRDHVVCFHGAEQVRQACPQALTRLSLKQILFSLFLFVLETHL